jgi:hypothetical protein
MKTKVLFWSLIIFMTLTIEAFSAVFFVSQKGAGDGSGSSYANRANIQSHNSKVGNFSDLAGDTVVLCGNISTGLKVYTSGTIDRQVIYDGNASSYYSGATKGKITNYSSASNYNGVYIYGKQYVTLRNIDIDFNYKNEMGSKLDNIYAIKIQNSNNIIIDKVDVTNTHNGIAVFDDSSDIEIINSNLEKIAESGIYLSRYATSTTPKNVIIDNNTIKNCTYKTKWDENKVGYDVRIGPNVQDVVISNNNLYADLAYHGMSGILIHSAKNILVENNAIHGHQSFMHRPAISVKGETAKQLASNVVVRYNKIFDEVADENAYATVCYGMVFSGNWEHIYVYGNKISDSGSGISVNYANWIGPPYTHSDGINPGNIHIWSNVLNDLTGNGITIGGMSKGTDKITDIYILNNTLCRVALDAGVDQSLTGISNLIGASKINKLHIKNNIVSDARDGYDGLSPINVKEGTNIFIANNQVYNSKISLNDSLSSSAFSIENPLFSNPDNDIFTLDADSPSKDTGTTITGPENVPSSVVSFAGEMKYAFALDPDNTDWDEIPAAVNILEQNDYGYNWEKGAFVYTGDSYGRLDKPSNVLLSPL